MAVTATDIRLYNHASPEMPIVSTTTVEVREAQARLPELVSLAAAGTEVILIEEGTPRVRLVAINGTASRIPGLHPNSVTTSDDFDDPLPDEFWIGE